MKTASDWGRKGDIAGAAREVKGYWMRLKQTIFAIVLLLSGTQASHAQDWFKGKFGPALDGTTRTYEGGTPAGLSMGEMKLGRKFASFGTARRHLELRFDETVAG